MSNIHHIHEQNVIDDEETRIEAASDWIAKIDRDLTPQERATLQKWLSLSVKNTEALLEVARLWDKMDDLSRLSDLFPHTPPSTVKKYSQWITAKLF